jgi:hypothetical protein
MNIISKKEMDRFSVKPKKYTTIEKVRYSWVSMLTKENYNTIITIQKPMKHRYSMDSKLERIGNLEQVEKMFYSVEKNKDSSGYHIHLMIKGYGVNMYQLGFVANIEYEYITYWKNIDNEFNVARYITKYMKGDQVHYNYV